MFRSLLLKYFERITRKKWLRNNHRDEYQGIYEENKEKIEEVYSKATHWHGTGRYHYQVDGNSKYEGNLNVDSLEDVLNEVLNKGGIIPSLDTFIQSDKEYKESVSTTMWRIYARVYLELHSTDETAPKITFGDRNDFIKFFLLFSILSVPIWGLPIAYYKMYRDSRLKEKCPKWASTINNTFSSKGNTAADLINICGKGRSTIKGNYGLLFGFSDKGLVKADVNPMVTLFETRFPKPIGLENITHIEVINSKVEEVRKLLKVRGVYIPVLPLEACEIYASKIPFKKCLTTDGNMPRVKSKELIKYIDFSSFCIFCSLSIIFIPLSTILTTNWQPVLNTFL